MFVVQLLAFTLAIYPSSGYSSMNPIAERVDMIELNHFRDEETNSSFDQVIFYEWSPDYSRFHVMSWCLIENDPRRRPRKDPCSGMYYVRWLDKDTGIYRAVKSSLFRETWTKLDPERVNKQLMEEKHRIGLIDLKEKR